MEHRRLTELTRVADLKPAQQKPPMSRRERLDRWIDVLERRPDRQIATLEEIEYKPAHARHALRADGSALALAYADPVLRAEGLASDRFGDAIAFFDLTEHDAHIVLCSCHGGASMRADETARRVRGVRSPSLWSLYFGWFR